MAFKPHMYQLCKKGGLYKYILKGADWSIKIWCASDYFLINHKDE